MIKKMYKIYYSLVIVLGIIFGIAIFENYSEKEELKGIILQSYANIIQNALHKFVVVENKHKSITPELLKDFMKSLEVNYNDFNVQFLLKDEKRKLIKKEFDILKQLKKSGFHKTYGTSNNVYYIALENKYIKNHYKNLFINNSGDIIGIVRFIEDERKDNIAGDLEENFYITESLFISIWLILIVLGFILLKILEKNHKLEIEKEVVKKNEQLKNEFLANISHEIRTPLNSMFGFIKLLEEKENDKEKRSYLEVIKRSGEIVLNIINDILDFSKIEDGKIIMEKKTFNLKNEIMDIYKLFEIQAKQKNIDLKFIDKNIDVNLISDIKRIKQVISNILNNAIKFTPEGKKIELFVSYDEKNQKLYVEIKDEGIGIKEDKLKTIFKPFSQADSSTTRKYGGTGLGLSISYKLVKFLGGELKVESKIEKGSKFYFSIPVTKDNKKIEQKKVKTDEKFNFNILLVEDNKANQMFMSVILKKLGITFDIANDGVEAVGMYKQHYKKYDFILMDENMPNMTGIKATKKIREFEKENNLKPIFIIAITANALSGDKEKFLNAGMDEYLTKPLDIEKLKDILRKIK